MTLLINPEDPNKDGLIAAITSQAAGSLPQFFNADGAIPLHIRCLAAADGVIPWSEDYETGDSYLLSIGNVDDDPTGGTYIITIGGQVTSALQYNSTAAQVQTALSTASTAAGYGNVTVAALDSGDFEITWLTYGAVPEITVDATYLRPVCEVAITRFRVGSVSQYAMQTITIKRAAVASATVSTAYTSVAATATQIIAASSASNEVFLIDWNDAYAGYLKFDIAANGVSASINFGPQNTLEEIGVALASHPAINYQTDSTADNIAVTSVDGNVRIEFLGTLSGATLAKTITAASVEATAITIITTSAAHGLAVGDSVAISGSNSTPTIDGTRVVTAIAGLTFTIAVDVTIAGTAGTVIALNSIAIDDAADVILTKGNTGEIDFETEALAREFQGTQSDSLTFSLHVKRIRGASAPTILSTPITLNRELINGATLSAPSGTVSAFVKKTDLGTNVFTWLGTPSSANLAAALTDETGSGAAVFGTSPTLKTSLLINNPANTFAYTLTPAAIAANRVLNWPLITATDTLATLGLAQTFTATQTFAAISVSQLAITGNLSAAAWTTNGLRIKGTPGTLTDTSSSGTVSAAYTNKYGGNTIAASSVTTFTNYVSSYVSDPIAGTNVTLTNKWAIGGDSMRIGTSNQVTISNAGVLTLTSAAVLGTPSSLTLTNATALPIVAGTTGTLSVARGGTGSTTWGQFAVFWDQKANSVSGDAIAATTWTKVTLNTEHCDTGGFFSVSSSVITVGAGGGGAYRIRMAVPLITTSTAIVRLRRTNNTAATLAVSQCIYSWASDFTSSIATITARVTLADTETLEVQAYASTAGTIGYSAGGMADGEVRIYSYIEFTRE